jgi:protein tyrosine phosphatase
MQPVSFRVAYLAEEIAIRSGNRIVKNIYVSGYHMATNKDLLLRKGITHIINLSEYGNLFSDKFTYKKIDIEDAPECNIAQYFYGCNRFIDEALASGGKVLVHCMAGCSRSPTIVAAYLVSKGMPLENAMCLLRLRRPCVDPNPGFIAQLIEYNRNPEVRTQ